MPATGEPWQSQSRRTPRSDRDPHAPSRANPIAYCVNRRDGVVAYSIVKSVQADIHEGLEMTITVLAHKVKHRRVAIKRDYDRTLLPVTIRGRRAEAGLARITRSSRELPPDVPRRCGHLCSFSWATR